MGKNTNKQYDLLIIGAGAAGMMAAITAARQKKVCILEKQNKAGKKLLATGNGKCNFTNANMDASCFGGDQKFLSQVLEEFSVQNCLDFFHSIGIYPKNKNGYYYPNSEQAVSVVNALVFELERLEVKISYETEIQTIVSKENSVAVSTNKGTYSGKKLLIATGLLAAPKLGSDGSLFSFIKNFGHRFSPILPALCGFTCKGIDFKKVQGVRAQGNVTALIDGKFAAEDTGEIQFTNYGLSGIPIFQISRYLSKGLYQKSKVQIQINLLPEMDRELLLKELRYRKQVCAEQTADILLNGLIHQLLSGMVLQKLHLDKHIFCSAISEQEIEKMADMLQHIIVTVTNYRDFEFAQVCTGGIPVTDIHWTNLESKYVKNIHFAGEILDVDGTCGGYNLHFAWATGYIVGKHCF